MITIIFRYFFISYSCLYIFTKVINLPKISWKGKICQILFCLCASIFTSFFAANSIFMRILLIFIFCLTYNLLQSKTLLSVSFTTSIISFALSYMMLAISSFILSLILTPIYKRFSAFPINSYILFTGILQCFIAKLLFHIKRLKRGMPFIIKNKIVNIGVIIASFLIIYNLFLQTILTASISIHFVALIFILLLALALLIWWRRKITQSYVEKLRVSEVEALYKEISDKEHEIEKLHSNNRYLARIIHKDNKLIPAMELAVRNYLQNGMQMKPEDARQYGIDLLAQLQTMAADREGIIQNYHDDYRFRPQIGLYSVDAIIYYMERRAIPHSIRYEYQFDKGLKEVMLSYIDENDAIHLLSDAIENSIIATMHAIKKEIKIHIGFIQDILFMDISDTGLPFEPATYQNFGLLQHTTHKDSGGSGVGLLDIWKLKHKYKISLQIYEYPPDDHEYTKKIRFFFDRRNHFLIQSYRSQEITSLITRSDLHVFPYVEGSDFILTLDEEINEEAE